MWQIEEKNLQTFPDDVNDFSIDFFHLFGSAYSYFSDVISLDK